MKVGEFQVLLLPVATSHRGPKHQPSQNPAFSFAHLCPSPMFRDMVQDASRRVEFPQEEDNGGNDDKRCNHFGIFAIAKSPKGTLCFNSTNNAIISILQMGTLRSAGVQNCSSQLDARHTPLLLGNNPAEALCIFWMPSGNNTFFSETHLAQIRNVSNDHFPLDGKFQGSGNAAHPYLA